MDAVIQYFDALEHQPLHRLAFLAGVILILWISEGSSPLMTMQYKKTRLHHAVINLSFTLCHLTVHAALGVFIVLACDWCRTHDFGIVNWLSFPAWGIIVFGILSMDCLGGWLVHIVQHKARLLWRMHLLHHTDNNVDVTSGLRHHPLEALFRWLFFFVGVLITGLPIYAVTIAQTLMSAFTMFTHANIRLPNWLDRGMSYILISPNMHKVHHHRYQPFTDSNYGTVFSIWDRMFATYRQLDPKDIRYGLDRYYDNAKDVDFASLLKSPFGKLQ